MLDRKLFFLVSFHSDCIPKFLVNQTEDRFFKDLSTKSTYIGFIFINGIGKHVKKTVINKKTLRPHISDIAPIKGALKNDKIPFK